MVDRWTVQVGTMVWAAVGFAIAAGSLAGAEADARVVLGLASVTFPLCAVAAGLAIARDHVRAAGVLLLLSVATPTYFAWPVNVPALLVGLTLLIAPRRAVAA